MRIVLNDIKNAVACLLLLIKVRFQFGRGLRLKGLILATNKYRGKWSRGSVGG
ncbi:hypothetical protein [uncultured Gammaproteobacteria bacterium]|nr:hypothetical protein [uncultured Gammaproteobacteria bacterium]